MSNLTSKLHETAPDTIWLCVSDEQDDYDEHFHTGNIEDVTWSDDKATEVAIEYRKVTPDDGKLVLHGKWTKIEREWSLTRTCSISGVHCAEITWFSSDEPPKWMVRLPVIGGDNSRAFYDATQARNYAVTSLAEFFTRLSPNIVVIHDDTLSEFK